MKINREMPDEEIEQDNYQTSIVGSISLFFSIGITISVFLTIYKLGLGDTPIVNWSWWIIVTPALVFPIFMVIYFFIGLLIAMIFHRSSYIFNYPIDDDED